MSSSRSWLLFAAALLPRAVLAWLTLGTADITNCFRNSTWLLGGAMPPELPYLPSAELFLWIGAMLVSFTELPASFAYKLFPILFDAATAATLGQRSLRTGLLYAIAPLPLLITAMHGQWEGIMLFFLVLALILAGDGRPAAQALAGAALLLSIIIKPLAVVLIPLFFDLPRLGKSGEARTRALFFSAGAAATGLVYLVLVAASGMPITGERVAVMFSHAGFGGHFFGLPPDHLPLLGRFWGLVAAPVVYLFHWKRRLSRAEATLVILCFVIGSSPLAPQYLCWLVPLALLAARERFAALYSLVAGLFLVFFYHTIVVNGPTIVFSAIYGVLKPFGRLSPPPAPPVFTNVLVIAGNYVLPLLCLGFAVFVLIRAARKTVDEHEIRIPIQRVLAPAALLLIAVVIATSWMISRPAVDPRDFTERVFRKIDDYDVVPYRGPWQVARGDVFWVPRGLTRPPGLEALNLSTAGALWVLASSMAMWGFRRRSVTDR